jgi:hypothetical protein
MKHLIVVLCSIATLSACSGGPQQSASDATSAGTATAADNGCKDFPLPIYPSNKELQCESRNDRKTAYFSTSDSLSQVVNFYMTKSGAGWSADTGEGNTPTHAVVVLKKAPGYASVVINAISGKTDVQIHAYPNGN